MNSIELKPGNLIIYEYRDTIFLSKVDVCRVYGKGIEVEDIEIISGTGTLMLYLSISNLFSSDNNEINIKEVFKNEQECYDKYPELAL